MFKLFLTVLSVLVAASSLILWLQSRDEPQFFEVVAVGKRVQLTCYESGVEVMWMNEWPGPMRIGEIREPADMFGVAWHHVRCTQKGITDSMLRDTGTVQLTLDAHGRPIYPADGPRLSPTSTSAPLPFDALSYKGWALPVSLAWSPALLLVLSHLSRYVARRRRRRGKGALRGFSVSTQRRHLVMRRKAAPAGAGVDGGAGCGISDGSGLVKLKVGR